MFSDRGVFQRSQATLLLSQTVPLPASVVGRVHGDELPLVFAAQIVTRQISWFPLGLTWVIVGACSESDNRLPAAGKTGAIIHLAQQ